MESLVQYGTELGWVLVVILYFVVNPDKFVKLLSPVIKLLGMSKDSVDKKLGHEHEMDEVQLNAIVQTNVATTSHVVETSNLVIKHILQRDTDQLTAIQKDIKNVHAVLLRNEAITSMHNMEISETRDALIMLRNEIHKALELEIMN